MEHLELGSVDRESIKDLLGEIEKEACGEISKILMPWKECNKATGGYRPGEITVIAGTEGSGKTYFILWQLLHIHEQNKTWLYMPLEDTPKDYIRRFVAMRERSWSCVSRDKQDAMRAAQALVNDHEFYSQLQNHICRNPRTAIQYQVGGEVKKYAPDLPYKKMLEEFIEPSIKYCDILVIDPITMMDYNKSHNSEEKWRIQEYEGQQKFINQLSSLIQGSNCHIVLVMHMTKDGKSVQGASAFTRFVHNVLLFQSHDKIRSDVICEDFESEDGTREVTHRRTLTVKKSRNGKGNGWKIAFDFEMNSPELSEYGVIVPEVK